MSLLQAQLHSATLQNQLLQQTIDNARLNEQLKSIAEKSSSPGIAVDSDSRFGASSTNNTQHDQHSTAPQMATIVISSASNTASTEKEKSNFNKDNGRFAEASTSHAHDSNNAPSNSYSLSSSNSAELFPLSSPSKYDSNIMQQEKATSISHSTLLDNNPAYSSARYRKTDLPASNYSSTNSDNKGYTFFFTFSCKIKNYVLELLCIVLI